MQTLGRFGYFLGRARQGLIQHRLVGGQWKACPVTPDEAGPWDDALYPLALRVHMGLQLPMSISPSPLKSLKSQLYVTFAQYWKINRTPSTKKVAES